jgi:outer membrane receptor protein involved in Fe transport
LRSPHSISAVALALSSLLLGPTVARTQETGRVRGVVRSARTGEPLRDVNATVRGTDIATRTDSRGRYFLPRVPAGQQAIVFRWLGFRPVEVAVAVEPAVTQALDVALEEQPIVLGELVVEAPSRAPERVTDAPAAATLIDPYALRAASATAQLPMVLETTPGVDLIHNGVQDFNLAARGFNGYLSSRVLVLQDGRDLALSLLGSQEWNTGSLPMEDLARVELLRGPGSALYGANAAGGVLDITTPMAREVPGTKVSLAGGGLNTLRGDLRQAGVLPGGRWGYRVNLGYSRSDTWDRSRTRRDGSSLEREYQGITAEQVPPGNPAIEVFPLNGQAIADTATGVATGDRDPVTRTYGAARLDYYADNGGVGTVEGGAARSANVVLMNGPQRVQLLESWRPWARMAWGREGYHLMAWWSGQYHPDQAVRFMGAGFGARNTTNVIHIEGRYQRELLGGRSRLVAGASYRRVLIDTKGTSLALEDDDRSDPYYGVFGQLDYKITSQIRAVLAGRFDDGVAHPSQWSPKAALVLSPSDRHSIRVGAGRGFWAPSYILLFVRVPLAPVDLRGLESRLRSGSLGPALSGIPDGQLFTTSGAVPTLAVGNRHARVERVTSLEIGYKGQFADRTFLTLDGYYERHSGFLTVSLPGVNSDFPFWTAPDAVPEDSRGELQRQVAAADEALGLTRLPDGTSAIVSSSTNAGTVDVLGVELGVRLQVTPELRAEGAYTYFHAADDIPSTIPREPNTPTHRGAFTLAYLGAGGLDMGLSVLLAGPFDFRDNLFHGRVPSRQTVNVTVGYQVNDLVRLHSVATNVFDQRRFYAYGASVIGRRVLAGVTLTF